MRILTGAIAGLVATVPMTAWMLLGKKRLSWRSQDALPPTQITRRTLQQIDLHDDLSCEAEAALTAINHFAYGTGAGAVYGGLFAPQSAVSATASGVVYGLGVWGGSYLGWLPAAGLYRRPSQDTSERIALMIGAHIVWGASLGLTAYLLARRNTRQKKSELERRSVTEIPAETFTATGV
jgi:hypothetical protein